MKADVPLRAHCLTSVVQGDARVLHRLFKSLHIITFYSPSTHDPTMFAFY